MNIVLHLGLPKTGSTFLQFDVFSHMKDINLVFKDIKNMQEAFNDWLFSTIKITKKPIDSKTINEHLPSYLSENVSNLISQENFYCSMFVKNDDRFILLERINKLFPRAKVILGIRDKKKLLVSWYKQYVAVGGTLSFDGFIENVMNLNKLNYEEYIERLIELYGRKYLYVYDFENLIRQRKKIVNEICDFIGCQVPQYNVRKRNVGFGKQEMKVALFFNNFFKSQVHEKGIPYPYTRFLLPHRYILRSGLTRKFFGSKIELDDLIFSKEIKNNLNLFFKNQLAKH